MSLRNFTSYSSYITALRSFVIISLVYIITGITILFLLPETVGATYYREDYSLRSRSYIEDGDKQETATDSKEINSNSFSPIERRNFWESKNNSQWKNIKRKRPSPLVSRYPAGTIKTVSTPTVREPITSYEILTNQLYVVRLSETRIPDLYINEGIVCMVHSRRSTNTFYKKRSVYTDIYLTYEKAVGLGAIDGEVEVYCSEVETPPKISDFRKQKIRLNLN